MSDKPLHNFADIKFKGKDQPTRIEQMLMQCIDRLANEGVEMCNNYEKQIEQLRAKRDEAREIAKKYEDRYFGAVIERDEARRQVCEFEMVNIKCAHDCANRYGWDCYKGTP